MPDSAKLILHFTANSEDENASISVSLILPDEEFSSAPKKFTSPLDDAELVDLRWYLKVHSGWPIGSDILRANRIEENFENWGLSLFNSVLSTDDSSDENNLWQQFIDESSKNKIIYIESSDSSVLRLPWELMANESGFLIGQQISIRRSFQGVASVEAVGSNLPIRVLIVVARPDDMGFVDPRVTTNPLVETLEQSGNLVEVEFLNPPSIESLKQRLSQESPPVHLVHFDCQASFDAETNENYLHFENEVHQSDRVDAKSLGALLNENNVQLAILNHFPGSTQEKINPYASFASALIQAGTGSVLVMNYSLMATATKIFSEKFYTGLASGSTVGEAVEQGRQALFSEARRSILARRNEKGETIEHVINVSDWFLPTLYQQTADPALFSEPIDLDRPADEGTVSRALTEPSFPGGLPAQPNYGFHGRSRELLRLERTLSTHPMVKLHGLAGLGKSALATEGGRWFYRTGRFTQIAYVSFVQGGSLYQLCLWVCRAITNNPEYVFDTNGSGLNPVEHVSMLLKENPSLVILDNFESITGEHALIPPDELTAILDAVWSWCETSTEQGSRILIVSTELSFNDGRFEPSDKCAHMSLLGMSQADMLVLAAAVLDKHQIDRTNVDVQALIDLMDHLGGHPFSLFLLLPLLKFHTPAELSAHLETILPGFTTGAARSPKESLALAIQFSLSRISEEPFKQLPGISIFQGGAMEAELLAITDLDENFWKSVRNILEKAALIKAKYLPNVGPPYLSFNSALLDYLATQLSTDQKHPLEERFWRRYLVLAKHLYLEDAQHPLQTRAIAMHELPNMFHALDLVIAEAQLEAAIDLAHCITGFLHVFNRGRERKAIADKVVSLQKKIGGEKAVESLVEQQVTPTPSDETTVDIPSWAPSFISAVAEAVGGDAYAVEAVAELLPQLEEDGWKGSQAIRQILDGQRDAGVLTSSLDAVEAEIISTILARLPETTEVSDSDQADATPSSVDPEETAMVDVEPSSPERGVQTRDLQTDVVTAAHIREEWDVVIQAVVAACEGDEEAASELPPLLDQMAQEEDWQALSKSLRLILEGKREPEILLQGLDSVDIIIAGDILLALDVDVYQDMYMEAERVVLPQTGPLTRLATSPLQDTSKEPFQKSKAQTTSGAMTLDTLLSLIVLACSPEAPNGLANQLDAATKSMEEDPGSTKEIQSLGRVLNSILMGERDPDLSDLPINLQNITRTMLATLT